MITTRYTTMLAVLAVCGLGMAQPAPDAATTSPADAPQHARRGPGAPDDMRNGGMGPFAKLNLAKRLEDLTDEQKAKIDKYQEESKAEGQELQKEFREAMEKARATTDREARRSAMNGVREKFQATEKKVDAFLDGVLTDAQRTKLQEQTKGLREKAGERVRKFRDSRTSATAGQNPAAARQGKRGKGDGGKEGKAGRKHKMKQAGETNAVDGATSSSANNPFAKP